MSSNREEGAVLHEEEPVSQDYKKPKSNDNCNDGADEKMLPDDEQKLTLKSDLADVKFIRDQQNGDTKVDILEMKQAFTGLTKEELMKYCNDPFWIRLRWAMFILFWLAWLGMLVGAIFIIIGAPKCAPPPPKTWWQTGPLVDLDEPDSTTIDEPVSYFADLDEKISKLDFVKGIFIPHSAFEDSVYVNEPQFSDAFKNFATKAKEHDIRLIIDLIPNYTNKSHEWFTKSENGDEQYKDYFIWADNKTVDQVPNNWVSTFNTSAWTYSAIRRQFYLHQFSSETPDLNFRNQDVIKEFDKILQFWLKNGANGVRLDKVRHLLVDPKFQDELNRPFSTAGLMEYDFYMHDKTTFQDGLAEMLNHWRGVVYNLTDGDGIFTIKEDLTEKAESLKINGTLGIDLPRASRSFMINPNELTAHKLQDSLNNTFNEFGYDAWPAWQYKTKENSFSSEFSIITSLLPGVPVFTPTQLFSSSKNTTEVEPEYKHLLKLRALPSMLYGGYNSMLLANGTVFGYTRLKSGNPGFAILYNPTSEMAHLNISNIHKMPSEVTVNHLSKNYVENVSAKMKLPSVNIPLSSKSVIILTYVQEE